MSAVASIAGGAVRDCRVMGTEARIVVVGGRDPRALAERARGWLDDLERRWSRFRKDSEISRCNRGGGAPVRVSPATARVVADAVEAWRRTDARFDPTVHDALVAAGYDRSFEFLPGPGEGEAAPPEHRGPAHPLAPRCPAPGCVGIEVDLGATTVRLPPGARIDLGGIGKGAAADVAVARLLDAGAAGACVDVGGDVRVAGTPPCGDGWALGAPETVGAVLVLADGGVATSGTRRRRWAGPGGSTRHHLLDPATGASVDNGMVGVTVAASAARWAEALTKAAFVAGPHGVDELMVEAGAVAWWTDRRGARRATEGAGVYESRYRPAFAPGATGAAGRGGPP